MAAKINIRKLRKQFRFLGYLQRLSHRRLVELHDKTFRGTKWFLQIPRMAHKEFVIKRLWIFYCVTHYHYPEGKTREAFRKRARAVLSKSYSPASDSIEEMAKTQAMDHRQFSQSNIKVMHINEVDRHLAIAGIYVEIEEWQRKRLLWEYYNRPSKTMRQHRHERVNNRYYLTDIVLAHPTMTYTQFLAEFGNRMPSVTRSSFNNARSKLRGVGYQVPRLRCGPTDPTIVNLDGKAMRGRHEEADRESQETEPEASQEG